MGSGCWLLHNSNDSNDSSNNHTHNQKHQFCHSMPEDATSFKVLLLVWTLLSCIRCFLLRTVARHCWPCIVAALFVVSYLQCVVLPTSRKMIIIVI